MGILAVGSVALDTITTPFGTRDEILGGSAAYFCIAASYFVDVGMTAVAGDDFPEEHMALFRKKGIDISGLQLRRGKTLRWKGSYGTDMNTRTTLDTQFNVYAEFSPEVPTAHRSPDCIFLGSIDPDIHLSVLRQVERPKLVVCDTIQHWIALKRNALLSQLSGIDLLIINENEARQLAGMMDLPDAARKLLSSGLGTLVIKRGEYGSIMFTDNSIFILPAFPVENVVDPTGAGDAFAGGMLGYLAATGSYGASPHAAACNDAALRKAVAFGTVMASFTVMDFGTRQLSDLTFTEINERYRELYRITRLPDDNM
jgi:sugar/nucleoside kinase (ribokinase family)